MKRNTYRVTIKNYNDDSRRTIQVKAPNMAAAAKLARIKTDQRNESILHIKDIANCSPDDFENREHCRRIAEDVEDYASGRVYRCPDCGEIITVSDEWSGEKYCCPDCGTIHDSGDLEEQSLYDYFDDCLDIEYRIGSDRRTLKSVEICIAWGGPGIYIDTADCEVKLFWWGNRANYPIDRDVCGQIDDWAAELFEL